MKWEYFTVRIMSGADVTITDQMNELGAEGWELVALHMDVSAMYLFFKRPLAL